MYKSILLLNEECIFENVILVVVKVNNNTMKMVNMKFSPKIYMSISKDLVQRILLIIHFCIEAHHQTVFFSTGTKNKCLYNPF